MTTRRLGSIVRHWRKKLGMEHWELTVRFAPQNEISNNPSEMCYGRIWPDYDTHTAHVFIARECDIVPEMVDALSLCENRPDVVIEQTVIHELLHARLDPASRMHDDSAFESGLNHTARALWELGGLTRAQS